MLMKICLFLFGLLSFIPKSLAVPQDAPKQQPNLRGLLRKRNGNTEQQEGKEATPSLGERNNLPFSQQGGVGSPPRQILSTGSSGEDEGGKELVVEVENEIVEGSQTNKDGSGDEEGGGPEVAGLGPFPGPCPPGSHVKFRLEKREWFYMTPASNRFNPDEDDRRRYLETSDEDEDEEDDNDNDNDGSEDGGRGVNRCNPPSPPPPCPVGAIAKFQPMDCFFFCMMGGGGEEDSGDDRA